MEAKFIEHTNYSDELITHHDQLSAVSESFKIARTNIEFSAIDRKIGSMMITSTSQSEGKSSVVSNLAITYAQMDRKVLLVDADLRRPAIHKIFGFTNRRGLTNALLGNGQPNEFCLSTATENLWVMPAGPVPPNPADLLMSRKMTDLIAFLQEQFDLVLFDCPPVGVVTDAAIVATKVDATIFVVRAGIANRAQLRRATDLLQQVNARVLGFILNGVKQDSDDYCYYQQEYFDETASAHRGRQRHKKSGLFAQRKQQKKQTGNRIKRNSAAQVREVAPTVIRSRQDFEPISRMPDLQVGSAPRSSSLAKGIETEDD